MNEFIVVSEELREWLHQDIKAKQPISCIKSLLPTPLINSTSALTDDIAQFIGRYQKVVCSIGVFTENYGFKRVAEAVESIREEKNLNIGLLLIDGTFAIDQRYKSQVLNNRPWVTVAANVPHDQVLQILRTSDVFVRCLASESYGLSRVEALWCGTPVVATHVGETRGMLLFDYHDESALIHQIQEALFNPSVKQNVLYWAEQYRCEAEINLHAILSIVYHKKDPNDSYQ